MEAPVITAPSPVAHIVERCEALLNDLTFEAVRQWKEKNPGKKAIGWLPVWAPRELILAAGMLPVGVMGASDRLEIVKGDAYYQSYICHLPRSVLELGLNGSLDVLDGVLFPSTCDVIRNLSGMWRILFSQKYVRYVDVPQNPEMSLGGRFFAEDLRAIAAELGEVSGTPVTDDSLRAAFATCNANRRAVHDLYALRVAKPWCVPSAELYLVVRAGALLPIEEHTALIREYMRLAAASATKPMDMARVTVRGCFCEQPPLDLIRTIERSGCWIMDDDWLIAWRWFKEDLPLDGDPFENMARVFVTDSPACPTMHLAHGVKGAALKAEIKNTGSEGVLFMAPSFCDPALLDQPMIQAAIEKAGIPWSALLYAENTGQFQVIREQAGTFADALKLS